MPHQWNPTGHQEKLMSGLDLQSCTMLCQIPSATTTEWEYFDPPNSMPKNVLPTRNDPSTQPKCGNHNTPWSVWHSVVVLKYSQNQTAPNGKRLSNKKVLSWLAPLNIHFEPGNTIIIMMDSNRAIYTFKVNFCHEDTRLNQLFSIFSDWKDSLYSICT